MPNHVVAVLAFDRISALHLSVPCVVFGEAHPGMPPFTLRWSPPTGATRFGRAPAVRYSSAAMKRRRAASSSAREKSSVMRKQVR